MWANRLEGGSSHGDLKDAGVPACSPTRTGLLVNGQRGRFSYAHPLVYVMPPRRWLRAGTSHLAHSKGGPTPKSCNGGGGACIQRPTRRMLRESLGPGSATRIVGAIDMFMSAVCVHPLALLHSEPLATRRNSTLLHEMLRTQLHELAGSYIQRYIFTYPVLGYDNLY